MNRQRFAGLIFLEKGRSPFKLSIVELLAAALAGVLTWLAMYAYLSSLIPFGHYNEDPKTWLPEVAAYRAYWLARSAVPFVTIAIISAISIVRCIRNDVRHFSRLGHSALALQSFFFLSPLGYFCFPYSVALGLGLAILASLEMVVRRKNIGNLTTLPVSIASILVELDFWVNTTDFWTG